GKGPVVVVRSPAVQYHVPPIFSNRHCNILLMTSDTVAVGWISIELAIFFCKIFFGMCHAALSPNPDIGELTFLSCSSIALIPKCFRFSVRCLERLNWQRYSRCSEQNIGARE